VITCRWGDTIQVVEPWSPPNAWVGTKFVIEKLYTRDYRVPLSDDDREMDQGWRAIPIPPEFDARWEIFDTSKDYKTGWLRVRLVVNARQDAA
jgi:hypothetical protein